MIYIVGVPRSGKSTLAKMLKEQYREANLISCEALQKSLAGMELNKTSAGACTISTEGFLKFVAKVASWNEALTGQRSIIDAGNIAIEEVYKVVKPTDRLVCLGFGGQQNSPEIWSSIQNHQKDYDYTYSMDLDRAKKYWGDFGIRDKNNRYFCVDKDLVYMDTNTDQENTLKFLVTLLRKDFEL